ncbi:IS66 family insertion sequence element accessory protein TnpA [Peribacillus loiseleuriae]
MRRIERKEVWQARIDAYKASGEMNVVAWCRTNEVNVQSMYNCKRQYTSE